MENKVRKLLFVESDKTEWKKFELFTKKTDSNYECVTANSIEMAKKLIKGKAFDIVIFKHSIDDENGLKLLKVLSDVPIIIVVDAGNAETAVKAMKMGAFDYIIDDENGKYLATLEDTIVKSIEQFQAEKELKSLKGSIYKIMVERRKELQIKIAESRQTEDALRERKEKMRSLIRLARQLETAHSYSEIVNFLREEFQNILGWNTSWIYLFEEDNKYARLLSVDGEKKNELQQQFSRLKIEGDLLLEEIAAADKIVIVEDARTDPRTNKEIVTRLNSRTIVYVPVFFESKKLGIMCTGSFGNEGVKILSPSEMEYLETAASHLARVIERIDFISERTKTAERITELAEFNNDIVSSAPVGIITLNPKGDVTSANDAFLKMMGSPSLEDSLRLGITVAPAQSTGITDNFKKTLTSGEPFEMKNIHYKSHWGKELIANLKGVPQKTKDGRTEGVILVIDDVTTRVEAEEALRESEKRFRSLIGSVPDGIIISDLSGNITFWNKGAQNIFGYEAGEIIGKPVTEIIPESYRLKHLDGINQLTKTGRGKHFGKVREFQGLRKDGSTFPLEISLSSWQTREMRFFAAIVRDITERKQAEDTVRQSEAKWRSLTENSPDHIMMLNLDYEIMFINHTAAGLRKEQVIGKSVLDFVPSDYRKVAADCFEQVIKTVQPDHYETKYVSPESEIHYFDVRISPVTDKDGNIINLISTSNNITERKKAEVERERFLHDMGERVKELRCLYSVTECIRSRNKLEDIFLDVVKIIPLGWQYPEITMGKIVFDNKQYFEEPFEETVWKQSSDIIVDGKTRGSIEVYYLKLCPVFDEGPFLKEERNLINGIARNISEAIERNQVEVTLQESEERYRAVVENSHDGILIIGDDFKFSYVNDTLCEILKRSRKELIGLDFREVIDEESNTLVTDRYIRRQKGEELPTRYEFNILRKNGEKRRVEISSTVVKDSKGRARTIAQILDITLRKQSEIALQKSEESLKLAQEFGNIGSWDWDIPNNKLSWSDQAFIQMGLKPNEIVPTINGFQDFVHPDDKGIVSNSIEQTLKYGKPYSVEARMIKPDGKEWIMLTKGKVRLDEQGNPIRFAGVQQDITKRKHAEQQLRESEDRYRILLEHSPDGMAVLFEDILVYTNKAVIKILTAEDESDIIGKSIFSFIHPDSIERIKKRIKQTLDVGNILEPLIENIISINGTIKKVEITSVPITYNQKPSILFITKDISELQKAYEEIQKNQERLTALVNALPDLIFILNKKGVILESYHYKDNDELYVTPREFLGKKINEVLPKDVSDGTIQLMDKLIETHELQTFNYSLQIGETKKHFEARMTLKGKEEILIAARDITVRKTMEKKLQESHNRLRSLAERLQMIREEERATIAREIHDDLGQSLTALKMDISWMKNNPDMDFENKLAKFDIMLDLTNSTIKTVKRIATELRPGIIDDLGLIPAIEWQASEFQNRFNIKCNVSINKSSAIIKDKISIAVFRIFQETLTNVAKHSSATKVDINLNFDDDGKLIMEIADNGIGIDKEQTNSPTSFGLFGMKERITILNGNMEIAGECGKGTKVIISIPI